MVEFLLENVGELDSIRSDSSIVDLGTGNGHLLFQIREEGFQGALTGVDYSEHSIEFAQKIAGENLVEKIEFIRSDLLDLEDPFYGQGQYDIVLDKGTFDAILLNQEPIKDGKIGVELYPENVVQLMNKGGILLITSCNFTESELIKLISGKVPELQVWKLINYPIFEFGGVKGSTICSVAFIKS